MYRTVPYIVLFLILALLQIFLFDNLSISIYLCPLVYIGFIVLLPIDAPPVAVLFLALSMSVAMDWAMGAAGINTIATLPVAMLRRPLLQSVCGKEGIREGGIPSSIRLGQGGFLRYLAAMVVVHHFLFFHVGVPVLGAVVPYARPTGREQCCYGGLHLATCAAVHH